MKVVFNAVPTTVVIMWRDFPGDAPSVYFGATDFEENPQTWSVSSNLLMPSHLKEQARLIRASYLNNILGQLPLAPRVTAGSKVDWGHCAETLTVLCTYLSPRGEFRLNGVAMRVEKFKTSNGQQWTPFVIPAGAKTAACENCQALLKIARAVYEDFCRQTYGKGTGLRKGAIDKPLAIPPKKTLAGLGKDRDEAFPFWDQLSSDFFLGWMETLFSAASKAITIKVTSDDDDDDEDPTIPPTTLPLKRTATGIISNRRPTLGTPASGSVTPDSDATTTHRLSLIAIAKREAAKRGLYSRFFRGPVLGPDGDGAESSLSSTPSSSSSAPSSSSTPVPEGTIPTPTSQLAERKKRKKRKRRPDSQPELQNEPAGGRKEDMKESKEERRERKRLRRERREARAAKRARKAERERDREREEAEGEKAVARDASNSGDAGGDIMEDERQKRKQRTREKRHKEVKPLPDDADPDAPPPQPPKKKRKRDLLDPAKDVGTPDEHFQNRRKSSKTGHGKDTPSHTPPTLTLNDSDAKKKKGKRKTKDGSP
ncbi:hypothetical protein HYDPIDRAFT_28490 [Hydnomerulius pinastri MD-312]|uniref:Uncharacterized protein n=1 Tax=Hydnomerulius pinastri MD-312 TaxID=994086 RepID=A0A0C9W137_9AGAM|nr:hypothetical protein HYDPIDRAFT_28490 [Hydnomerulius pinastri MD-312]